MLRKLKRKFVLINMAIVTAMLLLLFSLVYQFTADSLEKEAESFARAAAQSAQQYGLNGRPEGQLPYFTLKIGVFGDVLASGSSQFDLTDEAFLNELLQEVYRQNRTQGCLEGRQLRYYRISDVTGQVIAFVDISSHSRTLTLLLRVCVLLGILSLGVFLVLSIFLAGWAVKPVDRAWQQQRQFVSDASHELKTPLAVIMSSAELLQSPDCDSEGRQRFTANILTMAGQMRKLTEGLLELARADNGQIRKAFAPLNFSRLTEEALLPFEPVLFEQGLMLESEIQPGIEMNGSSQYLLQVVDILLDNAAKYAQPGRVWVELKRQGRGLCLLTVETPGQPMDREMLTRIFERFYRGDTARSRDGSFGLGLAIAKSTVTEHGGKIWAEATENGNRFCIQLPCKG